MARYAWCAPVAVLLFIASTDALAASKKGGGTIPVGDGTVFDAQLPDGSTVSCLSKKGKVTPGTLVKGGKALKPASLATAAKIAKLKTALAAASGKKSKALKKKIKDEQKKLKDKKAACGGGGNPTPPTAAECQSLDPYTGAVNRETIRYLVEKAGYGFGAKEEALVSLASQGMGAVVEEFTRIKTEPDGLIDRVKNWQDENLNPSQQGNPTFRGGRLGHLDHAVNTNNPYRFRLANSLLGIFTVGVEVLTEQSQFYLWKDYWDMLYTSAQNPQMDELLIKAGRHPFMLIYLNNSQNIKGNPNENYARELMELFSLGPTRPENGAQVVNYVEERNGIRAQGDVNTIARRLTGYRAIRDPQNNQKWISAFSPQQHEDGPETIFPDKPWAFTAENDEDVVRGIFASHPAAGNYYARELLMEYLTPNPSEALVNALGTLIRQSNHNLENPMKALLKSKAFQCLNYKNTVSKTSFELGVEFLRTLRLEQNFNASSEFVEEMEDQITNMGFQVTNPPSVFFFPTTMWTSPSTLLQSANFLGLALETASQDGGSWSPDLVLPKGFKTPEQIIAVAASSMGVTLNQGQIDALYLFMNRTKNQNGSFSPSPYNNESDVSRRNKAVPLFAILGMTPDFILN